MISAFVGILEDRRRLLFAALAVALFAAVSAVAATTSSAYTMRYYDLGNLSNADADVKIVSWVTPGTSAADIVIDNRAGTSNMYVQWRPYRSGYSWEFKRVSSNVSGGKNEYQRKYFSTPILVGAQQFRLCQDKAFAADPCGAVTTIYRYS